MHNRPALNAELNQDLLSRIQNNDRHAVGELIAMIKLDIDQLSDVFRRPDFLLTEVTDLIQKINAKTIGLIGCDELKEDRASVRAYLTAILSDAMVEAISTRKNYEQLLAGLNIIMSKKTGLTLINDGILKKTAMRVLERTKDFLEKLIKSRDDHLVELIQAGKLKEVRSIIQNGGKVDWPALINKNPDPSKGPLKTLVGLIKEDIDALFQGLATENINNLIAVVNQKTKHLWDKKKFAQVRADIVVFFREKILGSEPLFRSTHEPRKHLIGINALFHWLDLVCWNVNLPQKVELNALLNNAKSVLISKLDTLNAKLMKAAREGDLPGVKDAIQCGAEIDNVDQFIYTPLLTATLSGHRHIVEWLLASGANLDDAAHTVFSAASLSRFDIVDSLIRGGANLNYKSEIQEPLIIRAIKLKNRNQLLSRLINAGIEIDWPLIRSKTGEDGVLLIRERLIDSMSLDFLEIVRNDNKLVFINAAQRKLNLLKVASDELFAILYISRDGLVESFNQFRVATPPFDPEVISKFQQLLIGLGVAPKKMGLEEPKPMAPAVVDIETLNAKLLSAAKTGDMVKLQEALDGGANINCKTSLYNHDLVTHTPLTIAAFFNQFEVAQALVVAGADVDCKGIVGESAVEIAARLKHFNILNLLLDNHANTYPWQNRVLVSIVTEIQTEMLTEMLSKLISQVTRETFFNWDFIRVQLSSEQRDLVSGALKASILEDMDHIISASREDNISLFVERARAKLGCLESGGYRDLKRDIKQVCFDGLSRKLENTVFASEIKELMISLGCTSFAPINVEQVQARVSEPVVDSSEVFDSGELIVDLEARDAEGYTPLMNAARFGRLEEVRALLKEGASIDWGALLKKLRKNRWLADGEQTENAYTVLATLSIDDIHALVASSGEKDTDQWIDNINEKTSFINGIFYRCPDHREEIREQLVNLFEEKYASQSNPHLFSVLEKVLGRLNIIQGKGRAKNGIKTAMYELQLLHAKAAPMSPFTELTSGDETRMLAAINAGADVNGKNAAGVAPLTFMARNINLKAIKMLISQGAKIDWVAIIVSGLPVKKQAQVWVALKESILDDIRKYSDNLVSSVKVDISAAAQVVENFIRSFNEKIDYYCLDIMALINSENDRLQQEGLTPLSGNFVYLGRQGMLNRRQSIEKQLRTSLSAARAVWSVVIDVEKLRRLKENIDALIKDLKLIPEGKAMMMLLAFSQSLEDRMKKIVDSANEKNKSLPVSMGDNTSTLYGNRNPVAKDSKKEENYFGVEDTSHFGF